MWTPGDAHDLNGIPADQATGALAAALVSTGLLDGLTWRLCASAKRRTVGLTVERDASLTVAVPMGADLGQLLTVLKDKRAWMVRKAAERSGQLGEHPDKQVVSGENFPYLGRGQRLLVVAEQSVPVRRHGGRLCLRSMPASDGAQALID